MPTSAQNTAIAMPAEQNPKKNAAKSTPAYFSNPSSTINSMYHFAGISMRKKHTYSIPLVSITDNRSALGKKNGKHLAPNVGQMDRLNRLKAMAAMKSN